MSEALRSSPHRIQILPAALRPALLRADASPLPTPPPKVLLTCEHAGNALSLDRIPSYARSADRAQDAALIDQHWGYDLGAKELVEEMAAGSGLVSILNHTSRLYCDVNRPIGSDTAMRTHCDDALVHMNRSVGLDERLRRMTEPDGYLAFHAQAAHLSDRIQARIVASIHTFNPVYQGRSRDHIEIGVLSSFDDALALKLIARLRRDGFPKVLHNEPYSGRQGIMFSADQLGNSSSTRRVRTVMVEVRNDLLPFRSQSPFRETAAANADADRVAYMKRLAECMGAFLLEEARG